MPFRIRAAVGGVLISLAAVLVLSACGGAGSNGSGATSGASGDPLVVYSGREQEYMEPVFQRFEKQSGIPLDVRYGDSIDLALLIGEEGDRTPAGAFISQSPGSAVYLANKNLLGVLPPATLNLVPARYRAKNGRWVGITGRQRVLIYNTEKVSEKDLPASVLDLVKPRFKGKVGIAPSNASFEDFVTAMAQIKGAAVTSAWLKGMAANDAKTYAKNSAIAEAVARGEIPMGLVNHYYVNAILQADPSAPVAAHRFAGTDPGSLFLVSTASVPTAASGDPRAVKLVNFLLSKEGQRLLVAGEGEYPVVEGVALADGTPSLATSDYPSYDLTELTDLKSTANLIRGSGLAG